MSIIGTVIMIGWLVAQDKSCKVEESTRMHVFVHLRLLRCSLVRPIKEIATLWGGECIGFREIMTKCDLDMIDENCCDLKCGKIEYHAPPKVNGVALWCYCLFEPTSYILIYLIKLFLHEPLHMHNIHGNSTCSKSHPTMTILGKLLYSVHWNILLGIE